MQWRINLLVEASDETTQEYIEALMRNTDFGFDIDIVESTVTPGRQRSSPKDAQIKALTGQIKHLTEALERRGEIVFGKEGD